MRSEKRVVFVADWVHPRLGIPVALESLIDLFPVEQVELVLIAGPPPVNAGYAVTTLNQPRGWRGRLRSLKQLRNTAKAESRAGAVLVAVGSWAFIALGLATTFCNFKLVLWEHSILPWRVRNEWRVTCAALGLRLLTPRLGHIVCVSEANRDSVARFVWPLTRLSVIPNVSMQTAGESTVSDRHQTDEHQHLVSKDIRLFGAGSLNARKNWDLAVRAMRHLPSHYVFDLAGDGDEFGHLQKLITELGLQERVQLLGYVPEADRMMRDADVIVHPSFAETFGYTLVEAAVHRRPIVVLNMPVMNEVVPNLACGEIAGRTPEQFARAVERAAQTEYDFEQAALTRKRTLSHESVFELWSNLLIRL